MTKLIFPRHTDMGSLIGSGSPVSNHITTCANQLQTRTANVARRFFVLHTAKALAFGAALLPLAALAQFDTVEDAVEYSEAPFSQRPHLPQFYRQTNLVSDSPVIATAKTYDPNLRSAWSIAQSSDGPWWIADEANGLATVYGGDGLVQAPVTTIPIADPAKSKTATPAGIAFNSSPGFLLADGKAATFLISTLDGLIVGRNQDAPNGTAQIVVNHKDTSIYEGLAIVTATVDGIPGTSLFAPDFKAFRVDVYDGQFLHAGKIEKAINGISGALKQVGLAPFNIQQLGGNLYVTYAKPDAAFAGMFPVVQAGSGLVASFSPEGRLQKVLQTGLFLNAPFGVALAPGNFGLFSHYLLVGNNGDGKINVFNPVTGAFVDQLRDPSNNPIAISGLWGIAFGNNTAIGGSATSLFFAASAGADFTHGLYGTLTPETNAFGSDN